MAQDGEAGFKVVSEMLGEETARAMKATATSDKFGMKRGDFALRWLFSEIWTRAGLTRRERSFVTLAILIAQRQTEELKLHVMAAVKNGCTVKEIEEVIYQSIGYAGFPAATHAAGVAAGVLKENGLID